MDDEQEDARESEDAAQWARVVAMNEEGFTHDQIRQETGLTEEQVLQILRSAGTE
jgi:predicted transcriptional regulator